MDDAELSADIDTALYPDTPADAATIRHWWESQDLGWTFERFVALAPNGERVGLCWLRHQTWSADSERRGFINGDFLPAYRSPLHLDAMFEFIEGRAAADGAKVVLSDCRDDDRLALSLLAARGYREIQRSASFRIDLQGTKQRLRELAADARSRVAARGIRVIPLDRLDDPRKAEKLWRLTVQGWRDTRSFVPYTYSTLERFNAWLASPAFHPDRSWVAVSAEETVGVCIMSYQANARVDVAWLTTARSVRGAGVAHALRIEAFLQAAELGAAHILLGGVWAEWMDMRFLTSLSAVRTPATVQFARYLSIGKAHVGC